MPESASPRDVMDRLLEGISNRNWQTLHDLYAEDAVVEYPFALPTPRRLQGREAIRRYFEAVARLQLELRAHNVVVHETTDPEVVIVEYDYDALSTTTGRSFHVANILASRVRDGVILSSRDYHNHVALADATGQLPELLSALQNADPRIG